MSGRKERFWTSQNDNKREEQENCHSRLSGLRLIENPSLRHMVPPVTEWLQPKCPNPDLEISIMLQTLSRTAVSAVNLFHL